MTRDDRDRLFVAVNLAGEVWRVDPDRTACRLASGIGNASALNWGGGAPGFPAENLYVVGFSGVLVELANVTDRPPPAGAPSPTRPQLKLSISPKRARAGETIGYALRVTRAGVPVRSALVRFGGRRATTGDSGTVELRVRFFHPGLKSARASLSGHRAGTARMRVLPR
jgi:hypothetical protein